MPRCNERRCGFLHSPCWGSPSDYGCATRMTPLKCEKKIKELGLKGTKELWKYIKEADKQ